MRHALVAQQKTTTNLQYQIPKNKDYTPSGTCVHLESDVVSVFPHVFPCTITSQMLANATLNDFCVEKDIAAKIAKKGKKSKKNINCNRMRHAHYCRVQKKHNRISTFIQDTINIRSSSVEVEIFCGHKEDDEVTGNVNNKDAEISPSVVEAVAERVVKLVSDLVCAVLAYTRGVVADVARCTACEEVAHVRAARLALGSLESVELGRGALDRSSVEFSNNHTTNQACKGVKLVQPDTPELGNGGLGDGDTAEEGEDDLVPWSVSKS